MSTKISLFTAVLFCFVVTISGATTASDSDSQLTLSNEFDEWVNQILDEWNAVGIAVGAIDLRKGEFTNGYGYRNLEKELPMTSQTVMPVGSITKSFTAVIIAQLVEEGLLEWDDLVQQHMSDFQLQDEYASLNMRVTDLMTHVSGLPRHDVLWAGNRLGRPEMFQRLRYLEPSATFRGSVQYQNLMWMTAGYLAERLTAKSWDDLIKRRIFIPLGMKRSNTSIAKMEALKNFAYPYLVDDGEIMRAPLRDITHMGPAGSINSNIEEMLSYVRARMTRGQGDTHRLVSQYSEIFMQSAHAIRRDPPNPRDYAEYGMSTFGLGLMQGDYRGHKAVRHGGAIGGFRSDMLWFPDDGLGAVILANSDGEAKVAGAIVIRRVIDELLGLDPIDWNGRELEERKLADAEEDAARQQREEELESKRHKNAPPTHSLVAYVGTYTHPAYGDLKIERSGDGLRLQLGRITALLEPYHFDVFRLTDDNTFVGKLARGGLQGLVRFHMNGEGQPDRVMVPLESVVSDMEFRRVDQEVSR